jgi:hypothetical protein
MNANDVWGRLGELNEEDAVHVLTRLFAMYEQRQQQQPDDEAAALFFRNLSTALDQALECNLNRR